MTSSPVSATLTFTGVVHQNLFLPRGGHEIQAVLTLDAESDDLGRAHAPPPAAEVLVLDGSGSMDRRGKRARAVEAGAAAIEQIRDGVSFAVVTGSHEATMVWPSSPELRLADARTRTEATQALQSLPASGGTAIGQWLRLARELLSGHPHALRHMTLVTDGRNEHETTEELDAAIRSCVGVLRCDCRGVGVDFDPAELYNVSEKLQGTIATVAEPAELAADFASIMVDSMRKVVELQLELWTPAQATVRFVKQVAPTIAELTPHGEKAADGVARYLLGAWGTERRDYHICIDIDPPSATLGDRTWPQAGVAPVLAEKLVGRVSLAVRDPEPGDPDLIQSYEQAESDGIMFTTDRGRIRALWTDDPMAPLIPNSRVALVTGRVGMAESLRAGVAAWRRGDTEEANRILRRVRDDAANADDIALKNRMDKIYDEESGTFRLDARDEVEIFAETTETALLDR